MMEGSSFSDPKVIDEINSMLVAVKLNVTDEGWPSELPGLKMWETAFEKDWRHKFGFATSVVLGPNGESPFGTSGSGYRWEWDTAINYHPDKYLAFLEGSLDRYNRAVKIQGDASMGDEGKKAALAKLKAEVIAQLAAANAGGRKQK